MPDLDNVRFYRGESMKGTFRVGDWLHLEKVLFDSIRRGDIVVYRGSNKNGEEKELVHRVVSISQRGLITRGDNNRFVDGSAVTSDSLLGRVTSFERKGKRHKIKSRYLAFLLVQIYRIRFPFKRLIKIILKKPYQLLRKSGLIKRFLDPKVEKIFFSSEKGILIKYMWGKKVVAKWWPEEDRFLCRKPYDLIINNPDISELPSLVNQAKSLPYPVLKTSTFLKNLT